MLSLIGFIEPLVVAPRCKQSDSVARTAASSVFNVQVKRAHDVPLIRNLTNSSEAADARFDPGSSTHEPCVSPGGNYDSIRRVNGIVWIGRVSARLWYYSEEQMESCRPFVWSSYSFNFRTWERERKKQSERERERGGRNGDRGRVCASIQGTKIRRWCSRKRKRTKIAEPWRNYFGASPIIWTTVRIAMIHGSAVTFVERDHFRGFRISAWVINARKGNIRLMWLLN